MLLHSDGSGPLRLLIYELQDLQKHMKSLIDELADLREENHSLRKEVQVLVTDAVDHRNYQTWLAHYAPAAEPVKEPPIGFPENDE